MISTSAPTTSAETSTRRSARGSIPSPSARALSPASSAHLVRSPLLNKLQTKGLEQVTVFVDNVNRAAKEQITFAEQMGGEWRKLVLAATKNATEVLTPKA